MISVIIPIFNKEKFLDRCISSVVNQTYKDIEIILVNDGSTDGSSTVCSKYKNNKRVKYIYQDNRGVSAARNTGIMKAEGEKIFFVDADDHIDKYYIEKMITNTKADLVICGYRTINKTREEEHFLSEEIISGRKNIIKSFFDDSFKLYYQVPYIKFFERKILIEKNILFNENMEYGEDIDFCLRYISFINSVQFINYIGYNNEIMEGTLSRKSIPNIWEQMEGLIITSKEFLKDYPNEKNKVIFKCIKNSLSNEYCYKYKNLVEIANKIVNSLYYKDLKANSNKDKILKLFLDTRCYFLIYIVLILKGRNL